MLPRAVEFLRQVLRLRNGRQACAFFVIFPIFAIFIPCEQDIQKAADKSMPRPRRGARQGKDAER